MSEPHFMHFAGHDAVLSDGSRVTFPPAVMIESKVTMIHNGYRVFAYDAATDRRVGLFVTGDDTRADLTQIVSIFDRFFAPQSVTVS